MNSIYDPAEVNALNDIQRLVYRIYSRYEEERASKLIGSILQKIAKGGSYHDIYEYARKIDLGKLFKDTINQHEFAMNIEQYDELAKEFMKLIIGYSQDINDMSVLVQKALNDSLGIGIMPKTVKPKNTDVENVIKKLIDGLTIQDGENGELIGFGNELLKFSSQLIDSIIIANAEIQSKSGFNIVVVRRYDDVGIHDYSKYSDSGKRKTIRGAKECPFCKEREGVYEYEETKRNNFVWQRHPGCSCSIDYVNKGMTDRVQNYIKV